jgi:hypothetical protein
MNGFGSGRDSVCRLLVVVRSSSVAGGSVAAHVMRREARFAGATGRPDLVLWSSGAEIGSIVAARPPVTRIG